MGERSFTEPVRATDVELETYMPKARLDKRDKWLVLTAGVLGAIVGVLGAVSVYLILLEGM
jgi:hypothetical protein